MRQCPASGAVFLRATRRRHDYKLQRRILSPSIRFQAAQSSGRPWCGAGPRH